MNRTVTLPFRHSQKEAVMARVIMEQGRGKKSTLKVSGGMERENYLNQIFPTSSSHFPLLHRKRNNSNFVIVKVDSIFFDDFFTDLYNNLRNPFELLRNINQRTSNCYKTTQSENTVFFFYHCVDRYFLPSRTTEGAGSSFCCTMMVMLPISVNHTSLGFPPKREKRRRFFKPPRARFSLKEPGWQNSSQLTAVGDTIKKEGLTRDRPGPVLEPESSDFGDKLYKML